MVNLLGQVRYQDYMWDMVTPRIEVHREIMSEDELEEWRRAAGSLRGVLADDTLTISWTISWRMSDRGRGVKKGSLLDTWCTR